MSLICEGGDKVTSIEELYNKYFRDVYKYVLKLSGSEYIAEEITSETFFKAIKSIDSFRGDCHIRVYLCQIAKNCYFSNLKKQNKTIGDTSVDKYSADEIIEKAAEDKETLNQIHIFLHSLKEPYQEVFMWRVFADLSFKQIGEIFGKSENWACVTYHRARKQIIDKLEGFNNEN